MNQGSAEFGKLLDDSETAEILSAMNLSGEDLYPGRRPMVVSTGLPYVIVPLEKNILKARICVSDMNERLERWNAKFIGVLEIPTLTMRTWDNAGTIEDIATGSLAGPCGAYLVRESMRQAGGIIELQQGGNLGRPSRLLAEVQGTDVYVGGSVCMIAQGRLHAEVF